MQAQPFYSHVPKLDCNAVPPAKDLPVQRFNRESYVSLWAYIPPWLRFAGASFYEANPVISAVPALPVVSLPAPCTDGLSAFAAVPPYQQVSL